ncbi:hypothetical protein GCM10009850_057750 [Nonomuraea monospora]|uniref:Uncharacterized protein n=1 Tax=Nonomuraea monospora TaxID=568818 RepID=A0ABP5PEY8_9ACTN
MFGRFFTPAAPAPACDATEPMTRTTVNATAMTLRKSRTIDMTTPFDTTDRSQSRKTLIPDRHSIKVPPCAGPANSIKIVSPEEGGTRVDFTVQYEPTPDEVERARQRP